MLAITYINKILAIFDAQITILKMRVISVASLLLRRFNICFSETKYKSFCVLSKQTIPFRSNVQRSNFISLLCLQTSAIRQFSSGNSGKIFRDKENEYAHSVMEKSNNYMQSILKFPLNMVESSKEPLNIFDTFTTITVRDSSFSSLENPELSSLIHKICSLLSQASDYQIRNLLHCLCMWPPTFKTYTPNFKVLWNMLDKECTKRCRGWDVSFRLLIADYWFCLRLSRITFYNRELICSLLENCESLSSQQFVQLMFYVILQREMPVIFLHKVEKKLETVIKTISLEELGIICLAFFKTKNKVSTSNLVHSVIEQLVEKMENVNTITIASILKFLRKSFHLSIVDAYIPALHKSIPFIKSWDIPTSVHLALLSSECNIYHPLLLVNVSNKLFTEMKQARIKDCTKFSLCLTHFNHFEEEFYDALIAEVKKKERQQELYYYGRDLVFISLYYAYLGKYDYEILHKIFHDDFVQRCCSIHPEVYHPLAVLDYCVEIECKDYHGPRLKLSHRKSLGSRRGNISSDHQQSMQTRLISDFYDSLMEIFGSDENFAIRHILPHVYSPDIIFQFPNQNKKSIKELCQSVPQDVNLLPSKDDTWIAFVICGSFSFAHRSKQITGVTAMKLRQLQKLGYHVIFVPFYELPQNITKRNNYIINHINSFKEKLSKSNC